MATSSYMLSVCHLRQACLTLTARSLRAAVLQVPLRRVNAAYVIATSTKVDVSKADLSSLADKNFTAEKKRNAKKSQEDFFGKEEPEKKVPRLVPSEPLGRQHRRASHSIRPL